MSYETTTSHLANVLRNIGWCHFMKPNTHSLQQNRTDSFKIQLKARFLLTKHPNKMILHFQGLKHVYIYFLIIILNRMYFIACIGKMHIA